MQNRSKNQRCNRNKNWHWLTSIYLKNAGLSHEEAWKDMTTRGDLEEYWDKLSPAGAPPLNVIWDYNYNANTMYNKPTILNLGNPLDMGGTHWCAIYKDEYYDPFGLPPPYHIQQAQKNLKWNENQYQHVDYGNCGQFCLVWLHKKLH